MKSNKNASQETSKPELSLGPQKHGSAWGVTLVL